MAISKPRARAKPQPSLSEREQAAVMRVYDSYFSNYIKGDVKAVAKVLDDDYSQVGSAESEVFFNKKDAVKFLHDTMDQVAGKVQMRNREIRVEPHKEFVLVLDLSDVYVRTEQEWVFHSKFRASSFLRKKKGSWKIYHQHSSFPDLRAQDGENISIEKVAQENLQLRDAVKRRTVELEQKTRDLEVEAALERVRARAMGMRSSSELAETSSVLFHQLKKLQINAIRTSVGIFDDPNEAIELWVTAISDNREVIETLNYVNLHIHPVFENLIPARRQKKPFALTKLTGNEVRAYYQHHYLSLPNQRNYNETEFFYSFFFSQGTLNVVARQALTDEQCDVLTRFAAVFGLIYTRFLDLQQAESQAREAKIEAALERIRARAMAMHSSSELMEVADVLREQMAQLGQPELETSALHFYDEEPGHIISWRAFRLGTKTKGKITKGRMAIPNDSCALVKEWLDLFHSGSPEYTVEVSGAKQKEWYKVLFRLAPEVGEAMVKRKTTTEPRFYHFSTFSGGALLMVAISLPSEESVYLQRRAAAVFDLAYRRFRDLKKAEAQAKEALIEASLEKVRARALAMQKPAELIEVAKLLRSEMGQLGVEELETSSIYIVREKDTAECWYAIKDVRGKNTKLVSDEMILQLNDTWVGKEMLQFYHSQKEQVSIIMKGQNRKAWINYCAKRSKVLKGYYGSEIPERIYHLVKFQGGYLGAASPGEISSGSWELLRRVAVVFSLAYTRFKDLQDAEARAKEGQIELALERVRARSLAMHHTSELQEVANVLAQQLLSIGIDINGGVFIVINDEVKEDIPLWASSGMANYVQKVVVPFLDKPFFVKLRAAFKRRNHLYIEECSRAEKIELFNHLFKHEPWKLSTTKRKKELVDREGGLSRSIAVSYYTSLAITDHFGKKFSNEENEILKRFARVFEQAYTRFLDLQKAEAQAREATIEASLERVRAMAMAMHSSKDLTESIQLFYAELQSLGVQPRRVGVALTHRESKMAHLTTMSTTEQGITRIVEGHLKMDGHWLLKEAFDHWVDQREFHAVLRGNEINEYYKIVRPQISYPEYPHDATQHGYYFMFPEGNVVAWTENELSEEELRIFRRFTSVISLTYKRHKELMDAEERALLAVREASLDRVRAEIASMRTADDLQRITPLIWRELRTLGVPFFRCGVLIINDEEEHVNYYLSTPEGRPLAALHLPFDTDLLVVRHALEHWRKQDTYIDHWTRDQFLSFAQSMIRLGQVETIKSYQGGEQAPDSLTLQFVPFKQGMLYVGSADRLQNNQIELVHDLAEAFSTAYARYEDFTRLEAAKAQVENTLQDLRVTQNQLVQSEKMASLGELTAGIAHEIQNPLNFVNNFSEVSKELLDEMKTELEKGNAADAQQIAADVIQNLEKINFHGKRADGIVKSMLQHSRKSTGQKELTDINDLCDEYLRLAYHGLRAKDKSFNAKFETHLDPAVGKLSVLPQEIGRVILNLINNAFYAVSEKQRANSQQPGANYEPTVIVSTKNLGTSVEICVADNGNGIPESIKDKIFQPFFTTKPTGQGTGLGLSLSYDIVKSHSGELKAMTKEGEGSVFVITIPG